MSSQINIQPFDEITTKVITGFKVRVQDIELFTSANIIVELLDSSNTPRDVKFLKISGDDYTNWSNDDQYIINYVANQLGFTIITTPTPTP
jgi:hypothetical protein